MEEKLGFLCFSMVRSFYIVFWFDFIMIKLGEPQQQICDVKCF